MNKKKLGIYIHVPFCSRKCAYCNFYSLPKLNLIPEYIQRLCEQIDFQANTFDFSNVAVNSIYFGGGTPSLLSTHQLSVVLDKLFKTFKIEASAEISLESNPCSLNLQFLKDLRRLSFNRLSIGAQSAINSQLQLLGRLHSFEQCAQAFDFAVSAGFKNLSADLIIGLPGQTSNDLVYSFDQFSLLPLTHISIYILKLERGTSLFTSNIYNMPSDDETALFYEQAVEFFEGCGFAHYEISNFAKPGFACVHNLKYWTMQPYIGFGPSAHSYFNEQHFFAEPNINSFLNNDFEYRKDGFAVEPSLEWLMLRTRLKKPISFDQLEANGFKKDRFMLKLKQLAKSNLIKMGSVDFTLTTQGFLMQNSLVLFLAAP